MSTTKYSYTITGGPAPAHPPREFVEQQQRRQRRQDPYDPDPHTSSTYQPPPPRNSNRYSTRPPSSVYSQPSPVNNTFQPVESQQQYAYQHQQYEQYRPSQPSQYRNTRNQQRVFRNEDGVSPPSSPELSATQSLSNNPPRLPSPIENEPPVRTAMLPAPATAQAGRSPPSRTNIPILRRERRQNQEAAARVLRETKSRERLALQQQQQQQANTKVSSRRVFTGGDVRWDPQTGELSDKGRPSQVKPADYAKGLAISGNEPISPVRDAKKTNAIAGFASRLRRTVQGPSSPPAQPELPPSPPTVPTKAPMSPVDFSSSTDPAAGAFSSDRPTWQGASGRTTLVSPVRDTKDVQPLNIPRKSSKRMPSASQLNPPISSPPVSPQSGVETPGRETVRQALSLSQQAAQSASPISADYPSPPQSADRGRSDSLSSELQNARQRTPVIKRKPMTSHQNLASYDSGDPFNYNNRSPSGPPKPPAHDPEWDQPSSRFSVMRHDSAPRQSTRDFDPNDAPQMPTIPDTLRGSPFARQLDSSPARLRPSPILPGDGDGVMERRHPPRLGHTSPNSIRENDSPIVISLKTPWQSHHREGDNGDYASSVSSGSGGEDKSGLGLRNKMAASRIGAAAGARTSVAGSVHKMLPPMPAETAAKDRVTMLNAQLASLAQRRVNIDRSIKQMTELMPTDNLMASADVLHKRELEKLKVEGLRQELAEVQREEYEIGLKLHRAYKRLDSNAEYEPTTLWVRRVTG